MGYSYDPSGDVTSDNTNTYLYDAEERICAVRSEPVPGTWTMTGYLYDADGTRVAKGKITNWSCDPATSGFSTTNDFILGPGGEQVTEMTMNGSGSALVWEHTNVWAAGKIIATYSQDNTGSQTQASLLHFYFDDPLGSRRVQTDFAGVVEKTCQSLPFGDGETCLPTPTEHLFTGKERDSESGNDYFGARYYGSSMARFLSPDDGSDQAPSDPQSWNLYSYVRNNPLINTDPDGNDCVLQTRTSATTETASVASTGDCSGVKVGDGQSATYVNGTVTGITAGADGHSVDIGFTSSDGSSNGVQNSASAPDANNPGLAWGYGNNAQGYNTLGAASKTVNYAAAGYWGTIGVAACAIGCPAAAATAMFNARNIYYAATGLLPVAYTAVQKLANLNISVGEANELIESPTTQRFVDNANGGNINYVADVAGKLVRITTDPAGQKIISAGIIRASSITNYLASGRFTK
jgi:RHS repeat-associated protein